ncbi:MAG: hypothetical protein ACOVP5_06145 [Chitinophagales bacterium]
MIHFVFNILSLGLKPLYEKHLQFHQIITNFRNKLPRPQNQAKTLTNAEKGNIWWMKGTSLEYINVLNLGTQKVSLTETDLDDFYNKLNNFDFSFILFKKYYKEYIRNLNRFSPVAENKNFELAVLQKAIEADKLRPTKPFSVLWIHIKYRYKLTSKPYIWYKERKRKKKTYNLQ